MNGADPLAQLRDIHLPAAVSWWPPAAGWWVLAALLLAGLAALCWWLIRRHRARAYRVQAHGELESAFAAWQAERDASIYLQSVNAVLKRVALHSYRRETVARLSGSAWSEFLDEHGSQAGFVDCGFDSFLYAADTKECDAARIHQLCLQWVKQHRGEPC